MTFCIVLSHVVNWEGVHPVIMNDRHSTERPMTVMSPDRLKTVNQPVALVVENMDVKLVNI